MPDETMPDRITFAVAVGPNADGEAHMARAAHELPVSPASTSPDVEKQETPADAPASKED